MEGKRSNTKPSDLLKKIREITRSILEDICKGRSPSLYIDRFRNYCTGDTGNCYTTYNSVLQNHLTAFGFQIKSFCSLDLPIGKEVLALQRECHARRLDVLLRVLLIVQQLLQENRHGSKRDIYYMHPSVFQEQSVVDRAINDICILLHCSRHNLNVAHPVPVHVEEVKDIVSVAHYILVIEKESVFQRLANDQFCKRNRCIIITVGIPLVQLILKISFNYVFLTGKRISRCPHKKLSLPAYCLVDCDPYGFDILTTYRFGSMQMAYDAQFLRVPEIRWLGVFPSDSEKYDLPQQCLLPLTAEDKSKIEAMLPRCYLQREVPHWRLELELLLQRGVKFEIEALSVRSLSFLSEEYIPTKIKGGVHI
ncbi:meiotic recombination protein SPO11-1 isoform X2 [Camellia sinensis]|uniref:meiotic recombination protein SPO11-1 isoform X2 n=1 Tax=Camellia sinensis TaxID=4442 RepID=UPI001035A727|nr:meiotic recombination protein SPO11-1 isoform X2 [Camellia sinensis]